MRGCWSQRQQAARLHHRISKLADAVCLSRSSRLISPTLTVSPEIAALLTSAVVERYRVVPDHALAGEAAVHLRFLTLLDEDASPSLLRLAAPLLVHYARLVCRLTRRSTRLYRTAQEAEELRALTELAIEQERHAEQDDERIWRDAEHVAKRAPIVNLVDTLLHEAAAMRASDARPPRQARIRGVLSHRRLAGTDAQPARGAAARRGEVASRFLPVSTSPSGGCRGMGASAWR